GAAIRALPGVTARAVGDANAARRHPAANRNRTARYRVRVPAWPLFLSRLDSSAARITRCAAPADRSRRQCASLFRRNRTTHARIAREQYSDGHDEIFWRI